MPEESIQVYLTLRKCVSCFFLFLNNCSCLFEVSSFVAIQEAMVSSCVVMCSHGVVMMTTLTKLIEKRSALKHELRAPVRYKH